MRRVFPSIVEPNTVKKSSLGQVNFSSLLLSSEAMRKLITSLSRFTAARRLVQLLRLHKMGNWWLRQFPLTRRLPGSNIVYRMTQLESIPLAAEMFEKGNLYDASLLPENFTTFVDLGCNVGYFTCWLARLAQGRNLRGIMLDANPTAVAEAQWHTNANHFNEIFAVNGIVGAGSARAAAEFYVYESNICSTSRLTKEMQQELKGQWTKISVPCVNIGDLWRQHFNGMRCHLLKIDVEGSEMDFLKAETLFLALVDAILIEWHIWGTTLEEIIKLLALHGFAYIKTIEESEKMGTAFFRRLVPSAQIS